MSTKNQILLHETLLPVKATTASISCFASTLIAIMIVRSRNGLKSPYSRIIFGLSIADIIQSASIITSPFAAPNDTLDAPWAKGTIGTCEVAGFFLQVGGTAVPFYTLFLSYYFLKRVKDKITPQAFASKYEFKIHALIWLFPIIGGFVALARKYFNPYIGGSLCMIMDNPVDCSTDPDTYGTCIRGQNAPKYAMVIFGVPGALTFLMLVANLVRLTIHVHLEERLMRADTIHNTNEDTGGGSGGTLRSKAAVFFCCNRSHQHQSDDPQHDHGNTSAQAQSLAMQSLVQSSMYIASFFLVYSAPIVVVGMAGAGKSRPDWVLWDSAIFWPLGGFFNILIYTRPKVAAMRKAYPEYSHVSWLVFFLAVVFSGGEVPRGMHIGCEDESSSAEPPVLLEQTPQNDDTGLSFELQNDVIGLSMDAIDNEEDSDWTDSSRFEIERSGIGTSCECHCSIDQNDDTGLSLELQNDVSSGLSIDGRGW